MKKKKYARRNHWWFRGQTVEDVWQNNRKNYWWYGEDIKDDTKEPGWQFEFVIGYTYYSPSHDTWYIPEPVFYSQRSRKHHGYWRWIRTLET